MLCSFQDVQLLHSACKGVICNCLVSFWALVTMGKFKTNNDTSTPSLEGNRTLFLCKMKAPFFYVYMGTILSGARHIICAFNKGILFIGIVEGPAVPL